MKTKTVQFVSPFKRNFMLMLFLLSGFLLSSYKSSACTANFTYTVNVNGHCAYTSTSTGTYVTTQYSWDPGDGSGWHSGNMTFAHTYTANATYNAKLWIHDDSNPCNDTVIIPITVSNVVTPCLLSASFNVTYGAHGAVTFTSTSGGTNANTQYYWSPGDSNQRIHGTSSLMHTYLWDGIYTAWLVVEDTGNSYCIDSTAVSISVRNADSTPCNLHANFTYTIGANGKVTFTNTSTGSNAWYYWDMGDTSGYFSYDTSVVYTYAFNGTYNVELVMNGWDSSFCSDTIVIPVTITNACNLQSDFTWTYDSAGQVMFTSTSQGTNGSTSYTWSFGDNAHASGYDTATHGYSFIGYYYVTLTDSNPGGCVSSVTKQIYIYNKDSLQACFTYSADTANPGKYDFDARCSLGTDANTYYKWTPGDGDPSDSGIGMVTYQHTYLHNGPYSATLTIWYTILPHSAGSAPRYDESSYTQIINVTTALGIASIKDAGSYTIYPNPSDGSFKIAMSGMGNGKNAEIKVSNMMGQVIYQTNQPLSGGNTLNEISLPNAANGIYLLQITTQDNTYTSRIAIQK